jgi:hypothetical protein
MRRALPTVAVLMAGVCVLTACSLFGGQGSSPGASPSASTGSKAPRPTASPSAGPRAVVTIAGVDVDGRNLTVGGFVSGVSESGGTCQYEVSSTTTGVVVKVTNDGVQNAQTTSCGSVQIPIGKFTRGSWQVVLKYSSAAATATSRALGVQIP